jgi:hypothetical protein
MVGSTGIEPVTPSMSRKCATTTLTARGTYILTQKPQEKIRRHPDLNWGMEVLQTSALPLGYAARIANQFILTLSLNYLIVFHQSISAVSGYNKHSQTKV